MTISPTVEDVKRWLDEQGGRKWLWARGVRMPIRPEPEDYPAETQHTTNAVTDAQRYRFAQARKLIRLYKVWHGGDPSSVGTSNLLPVPAQASGNWSGGHTIETAPGVPA